MRGRRAVPVLVAAVLCAGCGVGPEDSARPVPAREVPDGVLADPTSGPRPAGERQERLFFLDDTRLVQVFRPAVEVTPDSVLQDLLAGPLPEERDRGLTTALPGGTTPGSVTLQAGVALVDLGDRLQESGRDDPVTALAQVVLSLTALPDVDAVQFVRDGVPLDVPRGDGVLVGAPLRAVDYRDLLVGP